MLKLVAVLLVVGGLWVWVSGRSITAERQTGVPEAGLSAAVILAPGVDHGPFDKEGTIVIDETEGPHGMPYLLYTDYDAQGQPSVRTKRLIFPGQTRCAEANLPCATNQPDAPVYPDQSVRVVGTVENEQVTVEALYAL